MKVESRKLFNTDEGKLFVWFPLHMTGPLVGSIIGLKTFLNLTVVLTGTFLAVVSWVIFFGKILGVTGSFSYLIPVFVITMAVVGFFVIRQRHKKSDGE